MKRSPGILAMVMLATLGGGAGDSRASGLVLVDFEDLSPAPSTFPETTPLADRYGPLGLVFSGVGDNGGAILDAKVGAFAMSGYSGNNILAFNVDAKPMENGGLPLLPETMSFDPPLQSLQLTAAVSEEYWGMHVTLEAFDAEDQPLDSDDLEASGVFQQMSVSGPAIAKVVVNSDAPVVGIDDVAFLPVGAVLCGDANGDAKVTAADALLALKTAVGSDTCTLARCDFNGDAKVSAADALQILKTAVGTTTTPNCPD